MTKEEKLVNAIKELQNIEPHPRPIEGYILNGDIKKAAAFDEKAYRTNAQEIVEYGAKLGKALAALAGYYKKQNQKKLAQKAAESPVDPVSQEERLANIQKELEDNFDALIRKAEVELADPKNRVISD